MRELYFIIGPTAVGKTALAIEWAERHGAEILCADAPLVYKGMDIGTAKPTAAEQQAVKHHGLDWVSAKERFSVGDYIQRTKEVVEQVHSRGKRLLIVGGSGFYLKSFFEAVTDGLNVPAEIVDTAAEIFETGGLEGLLKELKKVGGEDLQGLDIQNPRRVIKALERCMAAKKSFRQLRAEFENMPPAYPQYTKKVLMLMRERENLKTRIHTRVEAMLAAGLVEEVQQLQKQGLEENPQAATVIGYRETLQYIKGELTLPELKEAIAQNTLGLVRKQLSFFKQLPIDEVLLLGAGEKGKPEMLFG